MPMTIRNALIMVATAATMMLAAPAHALTPAEAALIVDLTEALSEDLGDLAYDEEAAEIWYEEDSSYEARIEAAGLSEERWSTLLDATMKGFFAALDSAEIDAVFAATQGFEQNDAFSEAQKQAMRDMVAGTRARIEAWRAEGAADAATVRPHVGRIKAALGMGS